jgi:phage shock protein PspC (stress-responsive transcriptional regulator)
LATCSHVIKSFGSSILMYIIMIWAWKKEENMQENM